MTNKEINNLFNQYIETKNDNIFNDLYLNLKPFIKGIIVKRKEYVLLESRFIQFDDLYQDIMMQFYLNINNIDLEKGSVVTYVTTLYLNRLKNYKKRSSITQEIRIKN